MHVHIKNFQSIRDVEFTVKGLTAVVGENNIGKSALFRSIQAPLENRTGEDFINKKAESAEVTLVDDDFTLIWTKPRGGGSTYNHNGQEYIKVRGVPEFVDDLDINKIEFKSHKLDPHFRTQRDMPFLVRESPQKIADFFSEVLQFGGLSQAVTDCGKDVKEAQADIKVVDKEIERKRRYLRKFDKLDELLEIDNTCQQQQKSLSDHRDILEKVQIYRKVCMALSELESENLLGGLDALESGLNNLGKDISGLLSISALQSYGADLNMPAKISVDPASVLEKEISSLEIIRQYAHTHMATLPARIDWEREMFILQYQIVCFSLTPIMDCDINSLNEVEFSRQSYLLTLLDLQEIRSQLVSMAQEKTQSELALQKLHTDEGSCPLCERQF